MAIKTSYIFEAIDRYTKVGRRISRTADKINSKFERLSTNIAPALKRGLGRTLGFLTGKFAALAAAAGAFFGARQFFSVGMRFQDQMAELSAITGVVGKDFDFLSEEAMRLAKTSVMAQDQVVESFKLMASAKDDLLDDPKALAQVTEQVLLLANASKVDLALATEYVGQALNQFSADADQAARFVNVLAAGAQAGASEVEDTGAALLKTGVVARQAGLSFEQTNAMLQTLAQVGLKSEIAGTGLQGVLIRLSKLGINFKKQAPEEVFKRLRAAINNVTDETEKAKLIHKLFGTEHQKTGLRLVEAAENIGMFTTKLTGSNVAADQASVNLGTFSKKVKRLGISINEALIRTFLRLEPKLSKMTEQFTAWLDTLQPEDIDNFASSLLKIGEAIGKILGKLVDLIKFMDKHDVGNKIRKFGELNPGYRMMKKMGLVPGEPGMADQLRSEMGASKLANKAAPQSSFSPAAMMAPGSIFADLAGAGSKSELDINLNLNGHELDSKAKVETKTRGPMPLRVKTNMAM